jgi:hypothetical protein
MYSVYRGYDRLGAEVAGVPRFLTTITFLTLARLHQETRPASGRDFRVPWFLIS